MSKPRVGLGPAVVLGLLLTGPALAGAKSRWAPPPAGAPQRADAVASAQKWTASEPADPLAGFDELGDAEDRALPEVYDFAVASANGARRTAASTSESQTLKTLLGEGWRVERPGGETGPVTLRGPAAPISGGASAEGVRTLLRRLPEVFADAGEPGQLEVVFDRGLDWSRSIRFRQIVEGARVEGAEITAHFDESGLLLSITSSYDPTLAPANRRRLEAGEAGRIAADDLAAAVPGVQILGKPNVEAWIVRVEGSPIHVFRVRLATRRPFGSWMTVVDAGTGAVLTRENRIESSVKTGHGNVFRTNADFPTRVSKVPLPNLFSGADNPNGFLGGLNVFVIDNNGDLDASPKLTFFFDPFANADAFDQVNGYFHLEVAHARFAKTMKVKNVHFFDDNATLPAFVNVLNLCNAFYTPDVTGDGTPGFAFGDRDSCPFPNEDFALDSDVIYHEYTHGVVDWIGIPLGDAPLNSYQRAMNEAVADYHSANFTGDPVIGEVIGITRDIDNDAMYPGDVACDGGDPQKPEEHCTGLIWSGFLWDVETVLKSKTEPVEFASLGYLTDNPGHVNGIIDFVDGTLAYLNADHDLNKGKGNGVIYGAATSRGFFGPTFFDGDNQVVVFEILQSKSKFKSVGFAHVQNQEIRYFFTAPEGSTASIVVKSTSGFAPDFRLGVWKGGDFAPFAQPGSETATTATGSAVLQPLNGGLYLLDVFDQTGQGTGTFRVQIAIK